MNWISQSYVPFYKTLLRRLKPKIVCEWGPGPNTELALLFGATVTTVEQDLQWMPQEQEKLVRLHIQTNDPLYIRPCDFASVDLFFVDSRRRSECVEQIFSGCKKNAVVCLHDCQRSRYKKAMSLFQHIAFYGKGDFCAMSKSKASLDKANTPKKLFC
jgi:hypothetical protein